MDVEKMLFELKLNTDTVKRFKKSKGGRDYIQYIDSIKDIYDLSEEHVQRLITYKADSLERFKSPNFAWKCIEYFVVNCDDIFNFYDLFSQPKGYSKHFFVVNKVIEDETEEVLKHFKIKYKKFTHLLKDKREVAIYSMFYKFKDGTDLKEHIVRKAFSIIEDSGIKIGYYYFDPLNNGIGNYSLHGLRSFKIEREDDYLGDYSSANGRFREDLSAGFKSSWEADMARLLNHLGYKWEYETSYIQTDVGTYIPDFIVDFNNNNYILEVKGKWDNKSVNKCWSTLNNQELNSSKYIIIDKDIFKLVCEKYSKIIPNWETTKINNSTVTVPIIGLYVGNRMNYIEPLSINDEIIIIQEKDNPFDKFAIKVTDKYGNHIGYVKKEWASIISTKIDYGFTYKATLKAKKLKYKCLDIELKLVNTSKSLTNLNIPLPLYK